MAIAVTSVSMNTLPESIRKFRSVWSDLDERAGPLLAANEALSLGYGAVSLMHHACWYIAQSNCQGYPGGPGSGQPLVGRDWGRAASPSHSPTLDSCLASRPRGRYCPHVP